MPRDLALYPGHSRRQSLWVKPTDASLPGAERGHALLPRCAFHSLAGLGPRGISRLPGRMCVCLGGHGSWGLVFSSLMGPCPLLRLGP